MTGSRIIIASDAIEAIGAGNGHERIAEDYGTAFCSIQNLAPQAAAEKLLQLTRSGEEKKDCKSDDATFVVVDF